jgi:hypothetical protein
MVIMAFYVCILLSSKFAVDNQNLHVISTNVEKIMGPINIFDATLMLWANKALEIFTAVSRKLDARRSV